MIPRWLRFVLGIAIVAVGLYVVIGEQFSGTSADAVINAQVLTLRAPIDGQISLTVHTLGARISANELLATLVDPRPDDARLVDLQRASAQTMNELKRLKDRSAALIAARVDYQRQADSYLSGRVEQIQARLSEANTALEAALARLRESEATYRRSAELGRNGYQSQAELNRSRSSAEVGTQDVQATRDRIRYLTIELESAKRGTFIGEAYSDAPYSQQRVQEMTFLLGEAMVDSNDRTERLDALRKQINEERLRLNRFTDAKIEAPVSGILWELMSGGGEYVRKAQDVLRLVDCTSSVVTASVREAVYNRLKVGDAAQFRLTGEARTFQATVVRLAGSGASTVYRTLAIGPSEEHLKRFDVTLVAPSLVSDPDFACAVGRTGRVTFSAGPLQFWRNWLAEVGLI
jgi:multidrug resistance efflux pump